MASGPITSWQIDGETMETVRNFIFLGSKINGDGDCSHAIKRLLRLGRKKSYDRPAAAAKSLQFCLTLCDPIDSSPPGSSVPGILQARTLILRLKIPVLKSSSPTAQLDCMFQLQKLLLPNIQPGAPTGSKSLKMHLLAEKSVL